MVQQLKGKLIVYEDKLVVDEGNSVGNLKVFSSRHSSLMDQPISSLIIRFSSFVLRLVIQFSIFLHILFSNMSYQYPLNFHVSAEYGDVTDIYSWYISCNLLDYFTFLF